jgi:hypothetical protein
MPVDTTSTPTVDLVDFIAAMDNPVQRNLRITQCYAELSNAMRARIGDTANWCTFATWASRQAGSTIRGEDFLDTFGRVLGHRSWLRAPLQSISRVLLRAGLFQPSSWLGRLTAGIHTPFDAFERASAEVAAGNLKVFAEIGREFARFLATVPADATEVSPQFLAFAAGLRVGPPPDDQDLLRQAFSHYLRQRHCADSGERAAWILLANLKIGLHEQMRLQPQILAAIDAPIVTFGDLTGAEGWVSARLRREAAKATQEAITQLLMVLAIPVGSGYTSLALGCDLDAPVPQALQGARPFLDTFVRQWDPCPRDGTQCGATDWCDLRQRMHFIVHLFRAYAESAALFSPPLTSDEAALRVTAR